MKRGAVAIQARRMLTRAGSLVLVAIALIGPCRPETANGASSVLPKGLVVNKPGQAYAGYTIYCVEGQGVFVLNIDGEVVHTWEIPGIGYHVKPLDKGRILVLACDRSFYANVLREYDWQGRMTWKIRGFLNRSINSTMISNNSPTETNLCFYHRIDTSLD